jgi:hypothetical protein
LSKMGKLPSKILPEGLFGLMKGDWRSLCFSPMMKLMLALNENSLCRTRTPKSRRDPSRPGASPYPRSRHQPRICQSLASEPRPPLVIVMTPVKILGPRPRSARIPGGAFAWQVFKQLRVPPFMGQKAALSRQQAANRNQLLKTGATTTRNPMLPLKLTG